MGCESSSEASSAARCGIHDNGQACEKEAHDGKWCSTHNRYYSWCSYCSIDSKKKSLQHERGQMAWFEDGHPAKSGELENLSRQEQKLREEARKVGYKKKI